MRVRALAAAIALVGCTAAPEVDDSGETAVDSGDSAVQSLQAQLDAALAEAPAGVDGITLVVHDDSGARVLTVTAGTLPTDRRIAMASASKLVSSLVFLRLVEEGALALGDTTGAVLGWTGDHGAITVDGLGAFASGLPGNAPCTFELATPLADCVATFEALTLHGPVGTAFDYGPTHQHTVAAMAQVRTGEDWATLFETRLKAPLGLDDPDLRYLTFPQQGLGTANPLVAGGLVATIDEYAAVLGLLYRRGELDGTAHIAPELVDRMGQNHFLDAASVSSPAEDYGFEFRYGFGTWLECDGAVASCPVISSAGAFGTTPWVDRDQRYYAILAMEASTTGAGGFSLALSRQLRPDIEAALGGR